MSFEFFEIMPFYNKLALGFFALAKLVGLLGFAMGFGSGIIRILGGCALGTAFFFLVCCAACCLLQSLKENKNFEEEDAVTSDIRRLKQQRTLLEEHLKELEEQRILLEKLKSRI